MDNDLAIPEFLRGRGSNAMANRPPRWKKLKPRPRPEGERWAEAERWEVYCGPELMPLACGTRRIWVVEGHKWAYLHDSDAQVKVPVETWRRLQRHASQL